MAIVHIDGFEHGVFSSAGTGLYSRISVEDGLSTPTASTATFRSGARSMRCNPTANQQWVRVNKMGAATVFVGMFYFRYATGPGGATPIARHTTNSVKFVGFDINAESGSQRLRLWHNIGAGNVTTNGPLLSANTWYRIDYRFNVSANPWVLSWQVDGTDQTGASPAAAAETGWLHHELGNIDSSDSIDMFFDDYVVADASGDYPLGEYSVVGVSPNASGTHNLDASPSSFFFGHNGSSGTALTNGESALFGYMDDVPLSGSSDYLYVTGAPGSGQYAAVGFANTGQGRDPAAVRLIEAVRQATAGGSSYTSKLYDGTSEATAQSALDPNSATEGYRAALFTSKPSGGAWTESVLDSTVARWGYTTDASPEIRVYAAMLEAAFPPGAPPGASRSSLLLGVG